MQENTDFKEKTLSFPLTETRCYSYNSLIVEHIALVSSLKIPRDISASHIQCKKYSWKVHSDWYQSLIPLPPKFWNNVELLKLLLLLKIN